MVRNSVPATGNTVTKPQKSLSLSENVGNAFKYFPKKIAKLLGIGGAVAALAACSSDRVYNSPEVNGYDNSFQPGFSDTLSRTSSTKVEVTTLEELKPTVSQMFDISMLGEVYNGNVHALSSSEIEEIERKIADLDKKRQDLISAGDFDAVENLDEKLQELQQERAKELLTLREDYLDDLRTKINQKYPTALEKAELLKSILGEKDANLLAFQRLLRSMLGEEDSEVNEVEYQEVTYAQPREIADDENEAIERLLKKLEVELEGYLFGLNHTDLDVAVQVVIKDPEGLYKELSEAKREYLEKISGYVIDRETKDTEENFYNWKVRDILNKYGYHAGVDKFVAEDFLTILERMQNDPEFKKIIEEIASLKLEFTDYKDVHNSQVNSLQVNDTNVFAYLSDVNDDGVVDEGDDAYIYGQQVYFLLQRYERIAELTGNSQDFYSNLSQIIAVGGQQVSLNNRQDLVQAIKSNPEVKVALHKGIAYFSGKKIDISNLLAHGLDGIEKQSQDMRYVLENPTYGALFEKLIGDAQISWKQKIEELRSKGDISDAEYNDTLTKIEAMVNDVNYLEELKAQLLPFLLNSTIMLAGDNFDLEGDFSQTSLRIEDGDIKKFFDDYITPTIGYAMDSSGEGSTFLGFQYTFKFSLKGQAFQTSLGSSIPLDGEGISTDSIIPTIKLEWLNAVDPEVLEQAGLTDFTPHLKRTISLGVRAGITGGFGFAWEEDRKGAIETMSGRLSKALDGVYNIPEIYRGLDIEELIDILKAGVDEKIDNKELARDIKSLLDHSRKRLVAIGYNDLSPRERAKALEEDKVYILESFLRYHGEKSEDEGWTLSRLGFNVNPANVIPILPTIGVSSISTDYKPTDDARISNRLLGTYGKIDGIDIGNNSIVFVRELLSSTGISVRTNDFGGLLLDTKGDIFTSLQKAGVKIYIDPHFISKVGINGNSICFGETNITISENSTKDGKEIILYVGGADMGNVADKGYIVLSKEISGLFNGNTPGGKTSVEYTTRVLGNRLSIDDTRFGL